MLGNVHVQQKITEHFCSVLQDMLAHKDKTAQATYHLQKSNDYFSSQYFFVRREQQPKTLVFLGNFNMKSTKLEVRRAGNYLRLNLEQKFILFYAF